MKELYLLEGRHMMAILIYIADNEGCMKTDIYRDVSHGSGMPGKIEALTGGGLIRAEGAENRPMRRFYLTDVGKRTVDALRHVNDVMKT